MRYHEIAFQNDPIFAMMEGMEVTLHEPQEHFGEADDLFEMANLVQSQTGIEGIIYISTAQASHGARVKYFQKTGKGQPSFSVSIGPDPKLVASSLPDRVVNAYLPLVQAWVRLNHDALQQFWDHGTEWTDPQVTEFKQNLQPFSFKVVKSGKKSS